MAESTQSDSVIEPGSSNPHSDLSYTANGRAEIDTSAPFESVREAATRFGGFGFWKPSSHNKLPEASQEKFVEETDIMKLKAQASELQNDLIMKECETLEVLKELEATKATVLELSSKLQLKKEDSDEETSREEEEEVHSHIKPAGLVLKDLNQAKMNLCKIANIRGSVDQLKNKLNEERSALEKTRERLMEKSLKVISLEEEEEEVRLKCERLSSEAQEVKKTGENAELEVVKAMAEIERTRDKIQTAKMRLVAARKMKEAARAAEAVAIAEIKAVSGSKDEAVTVTISAEEYAELARSAREAEEEARKRVEDAMCRVEEANVSKTNIMKKANEAGEEIESSKMALEEAVERVDVANTSKLEAEEALRNWRSENGQKRRVSSSSVNNTSKFKNRRETTTTTRLMDVNGLNLTYDVVLEGSSSSSSSVPVLKPTLSIGQILSKKLLLGEDSDMSVVSERRKMSLGQMLAKNGYGDKTVSKRSEGKENGKKSTTTTRKRKSFGFAKISVLLNKESKNKKKKKKIALNLR